jgi:hypothetical protein
MTPPGAASKLVEANHPVACPPQWLSVLLATLESPMPPPTPPPPISSPSPLPPPPPAIPKVLKVDVSQLFTSDGQGAASVAKELHKQAGTIEDAITEFLANRTNGSFSIVVGAVEAANVTSTTRRTLKESDSCVEGAALSVRLEFDTPTESLVITALKAAWSSLVSPSGSSACGEAEFEIAQASPSPPPSPKATCAHQIDFVLVLDESGSMKKPLPDGSMEGPGGLKAFAKQLVSQYSLGVDAARFSVVSFAADATTRVEMSYDAAAINAGIDAMSPDGKTSMSAGFDAARQLFADDGRVGATKIVLLVSDGEQSKELAAPGMTATQTAINAAALIKGDGVTVFAWGFGEGASLATLQEIATDPSEVILTKEISELNSYLAQLEAAFCKESPPPSPPPPAQKSSPPPPPSPKLPPPPPPCLEDELMFPCQQKCHRSIIACDIACNAVGGKKKLKKECKQLCTHTFNKCKASCIPCNADWNAPLI